MIIVNLDVELAKKKMRSGDITKYFLPLLTISGSL